MGVGLQHGDTYIYHILVTKIRLSRVTGDPNRVGACVFCILIGFDPLLYILSFFLPYY